MVVWKSTLLLGCGVAIDKNGFVYRVIQYSPRPDRSAESIKENYSRAAARRWSWRDSHDAISAVHCDYVGDNIVHHESYSLTNCVTACLNTEDCIGYTWNFESKICYLKEGFAEKGGAVWSFGNYCGLVKKRMLSTILKEIKEIEIPAILFTGWGNKLIK